MLRTLRQPRYAALGVLMLVVAAVCIGAGTWQIARFEQKVHENDALRANAHAAAAQVADVLPVVGAGSAPSQNHIGFRAVTVTGTYDAAHQSLVRGRTIDELTGFLVLTPLRTASGPTLLLVRGFVADPQVGGVPTVPAPPAGQVTVTARTQAPESRNDAAALLTGSQVESINPGQQAARLGGTVYNGYAEVEAHQPGTRGLTTLPKPDLSNPAGGALEPQHLAYVIQWYLFAVLALAAPFAMARAETRTRRVTEIDELTDEPETAASRPAAADLRAAKLADRYGHVR